MWVDEAADFGVFVHLDTVPSKEAIRDALDTKFDFNEYAWSAEVLEYQELMTDHIARLMREKWKAQERVDRQYAFLLWGVHL
jgi:hypothetical protein